MHSPQPLPDDALDRLFSALVLRYGTPFLDRWRDLDIGVVKADWARELAVFTSNLHAIRFGLDHLPEKPPTVMDFKRLCLAMPATVEAIAHDPSLRGPTPAERQAMRGLMSRIKPGGVFGHQWAIDLLRDHEAGWRNNKVFSSTPAALAMARDALRIPTYTHEENQP